MITYKDFILVKGKYYDISIPFDVTGFTGFNCELFTNSKIKITPANIAFDDGKVIVTFNPETLDDGVLYYEFTYYVDNVLQIKCTNTPFVIRTPEGYSAQTADEIYASGETAGAEAQKALLTGATIIENGEYVRPDGYSAVTVNVPTNIDVISTAFTVTADTQSVESETGTAWSAVTVDASQYGQDKYSSGYTSGYTDASALMPIITGTSYAYAHGDDNQITLSAETGTAFSSVTVDASEKFIDGYKIAVDDLETNAVELFVSANGIYDADIQYETRGYIKKVTVNVSGGTQEPFFGKVADLTGVGFALNPFNVNDMIELEFICPNLSAYTDQTLSIVSWYDDDCNISCNFSSNMTRLSFNTDNTGNEFSINRIENKPMLLQLYKNSQKMIATAKMSGDLTNYSGDSLTASSVYVFARDFWGMRPGETPRYLKSFKKYHFENGLYILQEDVRPRSDGKMWDLVTNQESTIDWIKYDETHPTTFNTLYEWEIS
jgi:hypothetical protein